MSMNSVLVFPSQSGASLPLCVDLDGTLTYADLSVESMLGVIKRAPWLIFMLIYWRLQGKSRLKYELALRSDIDVAVLPYNPHVLELIEGARREGRRTILVTGSNRKFAEQVQAHLQLFDEVYASDAAVNLTGRRKAAKLDLELGPGQYEYVSNSTVDLPIWRGAAAIVTVNAAARVVRRCAAMGKPHRDIPTERRRIYPWIKAMRLHQWAKNALLFVPLITAHELSHFEAIAAVLVAFVSFGMCASGTYIINDLFDLDADRHHKKKRFRPFAAGTLTATQGVAGCSLMLATGLGLALLLPWTFQGALVAYIIVTLLYSFRLKRVASLDVLLLAGLYTLRVVAGAFAAQLELSFWLLAFSMFVFLCLALVKRVAELIELKAQHADSQAGTSKAKGREYSIDDIPILQMLGASSGYLAVLVLALYINSPEVSDLYSTPQLLWLIAPLMLLWVTRLWMVTARGYMNEDPILFAIKDPETWVTAAITAAILFVATNVTL